MSENRKFTARDTALEVLMQIERANAWSDSSLKRTIAKNGLEGREAALATRLAYGVVLQAWPIVIANAITLVLASAILGMKLRFGDRPAR